MPKRIDWSLENFNAGMHTDAKRTERSEIFSVDQFGVRADNNGNLSNRYVIRSVANFASVVSGLAHSRNGQNPVTTYLRATGILQLYRSGAADTTLVTDTDLTGKLSSDFALKDVVVLTSEGDDRGKWIDLSNGEALALAYPLTIPEPDVKSVTLVDGGTSGGMQASALYFYALTYHRHFSPLDGSESRMSNTLTVTTSAGADNREVDLAVLPASTVAATGADEIRIWRSVGDPPSGYTGTATGGGSTTVSETGQTWEGAGIVPGRIVMNTTDESEGVITDVDVAQDTIVCAAGFTGGTDNTFEAGDSYRIIVPDLPMYLTGTVSIADTTFTDTRSDTSLIDSSRAGYALLDNVESRTVNPLPTTCRNLAVYNDRVFAACETELRYSDLRAGVPIWLSFPTANNIVVNAEILFCTRYRGLLLFGGPDGIWRLTGGTEFDFRIEQISTTGPVDAFAWGQDDQFLWFVGVHGLHVCDGTSVQGIGYPDKVAAPLRTFFLNNAVKTGAAVPLPNGEVLFNAYMNPVSGDDKALQFLRRTDGTWEKWEDFNVLQGHQVVTTSGGEKTVDVFVVEDGENEIREILWDRSGLTTDSTNESATIEIDWLWQTQIMDFDDLGIADQKKFYMYLEIEIEAAKTITVTVTINGTDVISGVAYSVTAHPIRPYRIPINRSGENIQVKMTGTTATVIRALRIVGSTL
jgi:pimeloyl-ACP methyl ester carboxylesterase|tara:strand:+ start:2680 stop:4764 length:2085 start_codon:yes stop_codon:yes gene_type:complete